jgi:hypothetical protein
MWTWRAAGALGALAVVFASATASAQPASAAAADSTSQPPLLRLFLVDGSTLVSYGEPARVGDRVVFSLPTSASAGDPGLHLVELPASHVDWQRTNRYAESFRAAAYIATHGDRAYALLTAEIGKVLNDVALTNDSARRLALVEQARRTLAEWPGRHYNYKAEEIGEMLEILDDAIADLRAAAGVTRFDLSFVAPNPLATVPEALLPPPSPRETIEGTLVAARLTESPDERMSLLSVALAAIERNSDGLPSDWRTYTRVAIELVIEAERRIERAYQALTTRTVARADAGARAADVMALERLLAEVHREDEKLGHKRPQAVGGLVSTVEDRLAAARELSLARERWSIRLPELRRFEPILGDQTERLARLKPVLENIRALAVSAPDAISALEQAGAGVLAVLQSLEAPEELRVAHALLVSAAQLATSAAQIRREAALAGDLTRAWDASAAAAGALMMVDRARAELRGALSLPQLAQ